MLKRWAQAKGLPQPLLRYWIAMAILTALSVASTTMWTHLHHLRMPYDLKIFWGATLWGDFMAFHAGFQQFGTSRFWQSFEYPLTYPAATGAVFALLYKLAHPIRDYLLVCAAVVLGGAWCMARMLHAHGVARGVAWAFTLSTLAMTWPLWVLFDTANIEGLVAMLVAGGMLAVWHERWMLGATLIGAAGAMKIFPLVLLALLLSERRYRAFAWGLIFTAALTLAGLAFLGPTLSEAQFHITAGYQYVQHWIMFSMMPYAPAFDHSLWLPVRFCAVFIERKLHPQADIEAFLRTSIQVYLGVVATLGIALYFGRIRRLPLLNQMIALTVCALLLPPMSIEYTLLHPLLPFGLLCVYAAEMQRRGEQVKGLRGSLICFAIIFNVQTFLNFGYSFTPEYRTAALIALLLLAISPRCAWNAREALR